MSTASPPSPLPQRPDTVAQLFWAFSQLALQGFGGVLAVVQRELVERRGWLTREGFVEDWSVAQVLPGPNVINLALMLGDRWFGWRGALAAIAGLLCFPLLILMALTLAFGQAQHQPAVQGALRGMGAVAAGLIMATAIKLVPALRTNVLGRPLSLAVAAAAFAGIALLRLPLPWVLFGLGIPVCAFAAWRLGAAR